MKRFFAIALALFFVTATSGLVMADDMATPPAKTSKHKGKKKHHKKPKKDAAATTAPATDAPAAK